MLCFCNRLLVSAWNIKLVLCKDSSAGPLELGAFLHLNDSYFNVRYHEWTENQ